MTHALAIVDEEFRAGVDEPSAPPTRLSVNLSERCQLRCAHCITDAPARTAAGTARSMDEGVLARLAPHLAHAAYVALVHAGEPMLAPLFTRFLEELRARRAGQATSVHLLTNGMALTDDKLAHILDLGVRSLSYSLDGMSASTNDVLRIGASAALLTARIARQAPILHERGARVGVSFVVTRANVDELPALVSFAAAAGLDWLKLEELFGHDELGLGVDRYRLDVAVADARKRGADAGVPVLDHTRTMAVWRCRLDVDARMAARARLDDLANRAELNPCRAPWETVCVEPNGDVKPLSFHHPVAGNLVDTELLELWRASPVFRDARRTVRATRLCGAAGPATCAADVGPAAW